MAARHGTIAIVLAALCLGACTEHDEDRAIEGALKDARRAVLAGDGSRACRLLTRHGRQRALAFATRLERLGREPPHGSCEEIVRGQRALAERDPKSSWPDDLREATFEVLSANDGRAQAELRVQDPFGTAIRWRILLRKTNAGWRIDDSNAVPSSQ
jgi:hypothetical protein